MAILLIVLWFSLLLGQLGGIPLGDGVRLYVQDIVLSALVLVSVARHGLIRKLPTFRLFLPITLFTLAGVLSLGSNFSTGFLYLVRWVAYAFLYAVVLVSPLSVRFWLWWLARFGVALGAVGLVQFVWYPDLRNLWYLGWDPHYYRVFATLLDPNYVGILLVLTLFLLLYLFRRVRWQMGAVGVALLLTYSRSSYLALLVGVGVAIVSLKRWKKGLFLFLFFLLAIVYLPKAGGDTLSLDRYDSTASRIQNWSQTIARIEKRPVFGYGFGVTGIDSSLLYVGVTTGIVGFASYLWLIWEQVKLVRRSRNTPFRVMFYATFAALLIHSLFVNSLFYPWVMIWMWVLVGVAEKYYLE
ncbi:O-antigen ligase family protein [Candidatus Gottesmanbacteria bacterium]|nr:O-antigen ligase family protein [Candidatus Gottesmanbacteria bacterium]